MTENKPKNIGELMIYLSQFHPNTDLVTSTDLLSWKPCTWAPKIIEMVPDPQEEGALTIPYVGGDNLGIISVMIVG